MVPPTGSFRSHKLFNSGRSPVMEANQFRVKVTVTVAIISHGFLLRTKFHGTDSAAINNKPLPFYFFFFFLHSRFIAITLMRPRTLDGKSNRVYLPLQRSRVVRLHYCMFASNWRFITVPIFFIFLSPPSASCTGRSSKIELLEKLLKRNVLYWEISLLRARVLIFIVEK